MLLLFMRCVYFCRAGRFRGRHYRSRCCRGRRSRGRRVVVVAVIVDNVVVVVALVAGGECEFIVFGLSKMEANAVSSSSAAETNVIASSRTSYLKGSSDKKYGLASIFSSFDE